MKRIATAALTAALALSTITVAAPAEAATTCRSKVNTAQGYISINRGYGGGPLVNGYAEIVVGYTACRRSVGKDYVRARWARGNFYPTGKVDCDSWNTRRVTGLRFRPYFWGGTRNFRRPAVLASCRNGTRTWTTGVRYYDGIVLYPADGPSKFRAALTGVVEGWGDTQDSTRVGRMYL